jgi:hypothetical protein
MIAIMFVLDMDIGIIWIMGYNESYNVSYRCGYRYSMDNGF